MGVPDGRYDAGHIYRIVDTPEKVANFLLMHVAGCLYLGYLAHGADYSGRLDGVGGPGIDDANTLAMQMATGIACASMLILQQGGWRRWLSAAAVPFMLDTMVMSGSRSGFLALIACAMVLWLLRPQYNRRLFYLLAVVGAVSFLAVASVQFWERSSARSDQRSLVPRNSLRLKRAPGRTPADAPPAKPDP